MGILGKIQAGLLGAAVSGAAAGGGLLAKKLLKQHEVDVQVSLSDEDLQKLKADYRERLRECRQDAMVTLVDTEQRRVAAMLFDRTEESLSLLDNVKTEASVLRSGYTRSRAEELADILTGPVISFLLALAALVCVVGAKWQMEAAAPGVSLTGFRAAILLTGGTAVHLLLRVLLLARSSAPARRREITVGMKLTVPEKQQKTYIEGQCGAIRADVDRMQRALSAPAKLDDPALATLTDAYCQMYQSEAVKDPANIGTYVMPRCAAALRRMDVEILTDYTSDTAHLFTVIEAPDYDRSFVLKPAMRLKSSGATISMGEYVKSVPGDRTQGGAADVLYRL